MYIASPPWFSGGITREVDVATLSGETVVRAYHQGAKSLAIVGTQLDKFTFSLYSRPEIKTPQDLRGKVLGVSRFGGSLDIALRYGLQQVGLDPKRDNISWCKPEACRRSWPVLPPANWTARCSSRCMPHAAKSSAIASCSIRRPRCSFPQGVTLTTREFLRDKRDLAKRFMAAYLDGLELFLKNPRIGKRRSQRFTGVKEERFLDADYSQYTEKYLNKSMSTEPRMLSIVFDRIGVAPGEEREKLFKGLVDNRSLTEAGPARAHRVRTEMATDDPPRLPSGSRPASFFNEVKAAGELKEISGAHWNLEIGALTELFAEQTPTPALLFDGIPDYPNGRRVLSNMLFLAAAPVVRAGRMAPELRGIPLVKPSRRNWRSSNR